MTIAKSVADYNLGILYVVTWIDAICTYLYFWRLNLYESNVLLKAVAVATTSIYIELVDQRVFLWRKSFNLILMS